MSIPNERQNVKVTESGVQRDYSSKSFNASETVNNNGSSSTKTDLRNDDLHNVPYNQAVNGDKTATIKGSQSTSVSGLTERISSSNYKITGNAELNMMKYQEMADKEQQKLVVARSQPDKVPDTSAAASLADLFKLAPGISKCIKQPAAEKVKEQMSKVKPPSSGAVIGGIMYDVQCELIKLGALISSCSTETLGQMAKIQKDYMKEKAEANLEAKKKMFSKMKTPSATAFKENMGNMICPDGKFSLDGTINAASMLTNPANLMAMFIPPSTENLPKKDCFDKNEYQKMAAEAVQKRGGVTDYERNT